MNTIYVYMFTVTFPSISKASSNCITLTSASVTTFPLTLSLLPPSFTYKEHYGYLVPHLVV